jgi:fructose-1,6-bisphosphatase I
MLVTSIGHGVQVFTLDPAIGEFILTQRDLQMPEKPKRIYSCNEGNYSSFDTPTQKFLTECKEGPTAFSARYVGSMVADVHRTLQYGGIFMYPATAKAPEGKLRLLYEGAPMAFLCEKAGGMASLGRADRLSGSSRVLDLCPRHIHQRTPIFLGSTVDVLAVEKLYEEEGSPVEALEEEEAKTVHTTS